MDLVLFNTEIDYILSTNCLTNREKRIVNLLLEGFNNSEISRMLGCSEGCIRYKRKAINNKISNFMKTQFTETYTIYKHVFPNNKSYIGVTKLNVEQRWKNGLGYINNQTMFNDILIYGWSNIKHEILETFNGSQTEAYSKERYYIEMYQTNNPERGYNR